MNRSEKKYYNFHSAYGYVCLNYNDRYPALDITTLKSALEQWISTRNNKSKIDYMAMSTILSGNNKHSHVFFKLEETAHSRKKPVIMINNITYNLDFTNVTEHPEFDGSFINIIKYLQRQATNHNEQAKFEEDGKKPNTKGRTSGNEIMKALEIPTLKEASAFLQDSSPTWWLNNSKKFKDAWREKHANDKPERIKIKLYPWDENNPLVKNARAWLKIVKSGKVKRTKLLVLLGETRIGKSEFINDLLKDIKVQEFRGRVMFDGKDSLSKYEVRLFDDANLADMDWFEFKAIVSTNGEKITMNVKYDHADVITLPTIVVLNTENWNLIKDIAKERGDAKWLEENTTVLFSKDKLYKQPERRKKTIEQLKEKYGDLDPDILSMYSQADEDEIISEENEVNMDEFTDDADITIPEDIINTPVPTELLMTSEENREKKKSLILSLLKENNKAIVPPKEPDVELTQQARELANRWLGGNFN
ncbi:Hypothetical protein EHI5A_175220 [Entamoeba histolytica KU27]|uniref:Uncharacterized protein n=1 Tax=Entamoeba histolytica KU27 TaxID=885311 RepID=M2PZY6_ENTHI|nr:Hypothetical protein EHI5A_175220 [Entamoeba histolytica KU27]